MQALGVSLGVGRLLEPAAAADLITFAKPTARGGSEDPPYISGVGRLLEPAARRI
jgi:hypothetical protein